MKRSFLLLMLGLTANVVFAFTGPLTCNESYSIGYMTGSSGKGKVYVSTTQTTSIPEENWVDLPLEGLNSTIEYEHGETNVSQGWSFTYDIYAYADAYDGSSFDGWYKEDGTKVEGVEYHDTKKHTINSDNDYRKVDYGVYKQYFIDITYPKFYAKFTAKTYHFISPSIRAVYQGENGIETGGGTVSLVYNGGADDRPGEGSSEWKPQIIGSPVSQQGDGINDGWTFAYSYHAKADDGYVFKGWHTINGTTLTKVSDDIDYVPIGTPSTATESANAPQGPVMVALFKKSTTYWHTGVSVNIAGYEDERAEKGWVFADDGTLGTVEEVEREGKWVKSLHDETAYPEVDQTEYKYTYYAKSSDTTKYAFKGWARTPFGTVDYEGSEANRVLSDYPFTMTDDNDSEINAYPTPTLYAVFESFFFRCPPVAVADNSRGGGWVHVSLTPASIENCTKEEISAGADLQQVAATKDAHPYTVYYYAKKENGAEFVGWSTTADGLNILPNSIGKAEYSTTYESQNKSKNAPHVAAPLYAVFRHDFDIRQQDRMIVYDDEDGNKSINDAKVLIDFQKGNTLTATLSGADASYFTLSNRSGSKKGSTITFDATQGLIEMVVAYQGDLAEAVGKKAEITLSAIYGSYTDSVKRNVTIIVEEAPMITFLPTDGKGSYTIKMTNGSGINYTMSAAAKENINVQVTHESMSNLEMNISDLSGDEYRFFGWQMIDGATTTYISYDDLVNYQFTKSVKVRPEFIHNSRATYSIIGDNTNTPYHDFAQVMKDAGELAESMGVSQTVLLNDSWKGETITEGVLPKGNYTIPKGVNLLIPGDTAHTYRTNLTRDAGDFLNQSGLKSAEHIRWIVEEGTNITVQENANILVYSRIVTYSNDDNGRPYQYGHIELKENCKLNFLSGSNLYVYGYITGPLTSEITMNSGTTVKEVFQVKDWRGGSATSSILLGGLFGSKKVFLIGQYYAQNIEVPLVLKKGASEILEAGISDLADMDVDFIVSNTGAGLFRMGEGTWVKKYYDPYTDRICFIGSKDEGATGEIQVNYVRIDAGIATVSSADYVLPIPSNFDIKIQGNLTGILENDFAFMPGSTLTVEKGSTLKVKKRLFAYDDIYKTIDGKGYYGAGNKVLAPLTYRPGETGKEFKYKRTEADLVDAKFIIDGEMICDGGEIYTTNATTQNTNHANITSNGGGKVTFGSLSGYDTKVYQIYQEGTSPSYKEVPVSPARLRHGDGNYETNPQTGTYTYVTNKWTLNASTTTDPFIPKVVDSIPRFTVSEVPEASTYVGKSTTITVSAAPNNLDIPTEDWANPAKMTWEYELIGTDANQFALSGNEGAGTITFDPTSEGRKTVTLRITATYTCNVNIANTAVKYTYSRDVQLVGNATYLAANTLAFADLSTLYKGQSGVALFTTSKNTQPITITANPASAVTVTGNTAAATIAGNTIGEVTLTATQPADLTNNIAATTITKKINVNDPVQWNWDVLYLGEQYDTPITMLDSTTGWTLTEAKDDFNIIDFKGTAPNYTASVANLIAGSFKIDFTFTQNGQSRKFTSHVIVDPRHLRVDVNNDTVFRAVTLSANEVVDFREGQNGGDGQIVFTSTESSISQWKLGFFGVPDKIYFQAAGANTWQIEESSNGTNWTTSFPWKSIAAKTDFEHSLLPSTRFLRISYGAGKTAPASLKELYITELTDVKANVEKLYIPVQKDADGNVIPYTKEVVFTYANTGELGIGTTNPTFFKLKESTSTGAAGDVVTIRATDEENPFGIKGIEVISTATEEMEGYLEVYEGNTLVLQIPIQTYLFPQELPIKLATDKPDGGDRYYYVTTHTHNAEWDGRDGVRTITLNNAVSDAAPYLTFEYKGNPTYIGFNHAVSAKGTWELEQFINGNWAFVPHNPAKDVMDPATGTFKRFVDPNASKLRVIYQSEYAEKVDITDLVIVGDASAIVDPARMELDLGVAEDLNVLAINLPELIVTSTNPNFTIAYNNGTLSSYETTHTLNNTQFAILNGSSMGDIPFKVIWSGTEAIEHGTLELTATINDEVKLLATVELVGMKANITNGNLGINTGVPAGYTLAGKYKADGVTLSGRWQGDTHRPVNIDAAFDPNGNAMFDYVVVYGETTTSDGSKTINQPNTLLGSNAKTPCYIYKKNGTQYQFYKSVENANSKEKTWNETSQEDMDAVQIPNGQTAISMYITGFCPYASTGYTKGDEGVWYFRADSAQSINVYLQDCYIYSRAKTHDGHSFVDRQDGNSFSSGYSCGSGAVLVFACNNKDNGGKPMNVTIHTLDSSLLKSNYGCFLQSVAGRAFQVSPAIQIRLINDQYYQTTTTVLNFTDEWPASQHAKTGAEKRTNGFLSLQKQHNNAPSIDMGNARTVVNFNGGQVELQNAQIVSTNYISSMAICHRTGKFAGVLLAYGLGTDGVGGTVNFNDGTTTVLPMEVAANYRQYYLMDTDANGNELATTSCLRTPQNTFVTGGSHCMMRACSSPTSKGGAPKDKAGNDGKLLGLYKFPKNPEAGKKGGWTEGENGLVTVVTSEMDAVNHQVPVGYNVNSITPNNNGTKDNKEDDFLNFWFDPDFEPSAKPEIDMPSKFWKTCMTEIDAQYGGYGAEEKVGGDATIAMQNGKQHEEVVNLMYCKIDEYIHAEISDSSYAAPVKNPAHVGEKYLSVKPSFVGAEIEHYITNEQSFQVKNKVYYITTATADVWNAFTAPFDVEKVYIMETYPEQLLKDMEGTVVGEDTLNRIDIIKEQAKHNADFAAFFAVTVALGQPKDFQTIYSEYIDWAKAEDKASGVWNGMGAYTLRGMSELVPYKGSNWEDADFYLNENVGVWEWNNMDSLENGYFTTTWQFPDASDTILLHQGKTYSMLLPFCTKCGNDINSRKYWDYWSGKFLIFESTDGPHVINGSDVLDENNLEGIFATMPNNGEALLKGNSTFAKMETLNKDLFTFTGDLQHSTFYNNFAYDDLTGGAIPQTIAPTESFLMPNISSVLPIGTRLRGVTTSGQAIFDVDNSGDGTTTDVHRPTIGGGNSLFITETANGINIAVAEPQHVRVLSSTGVLLYNGMVQNAVDVTLPTAGVYVVAGENEVQKILF